LRITTFSPADAVVWSFLEILLRDACPCARQRGRWLGFKWLHPNGGPFSGDLGSFRFKGTLPKGKSALVALKGRVADLSPVFGTATVAKDGTFAEIGVTLFADGIQGQI
jgi:hypothetical protein